MAFLPLLEEVVRSVDGALACSVMGFDGIAVENFQVDAASDLDVQSTLIEYAAVLGQVKNAAQLLKTGAVTEVSINSDQVLTVMRLVTDEYFVVLALRASGNYGKTRVAAGIVGAADLTLGERVETPEQESTMMCLPWKCKPLA